VEESKEEEKVIQKKVDEMNAKEDKQTRNEESKKEERVKDRNTMATMDYPISLNEMDSQTNRDTMVPIDPSFLSDRGSLALLENSLTMIILRGLPGSGKSTLARKVKEALPQAEICSADHYFTDDQSGEYRFDRSQLSEAHSACQATAEALCQVWSPVIVIDNTNVQKFEIYPYIKLANRYRYSVLVLETQTPWAKDPEELARRNTHGVARELIAKKVNQWQQISPWYYGWFLHLSDSQLLLKRALSSISLILPSIQEEQQTWLPATSIELSSRYSRQMLHGPSREILHCTSCYLGKSQRHQQDCCQQKNQGQEASPNQEQVHEVCGRAAGQAFPLTVVGFFITPRTWGARVTLSKEQMKLWLKDKVPASPSLGTPHIKDLHSKLPKNSKERTPANKVKRGEDEQVKLEGGFEACQTTMVVQPRAVTVDDKEEGSNSGRRAHITLGCAEGVRPVQAGIDLENILEELDLGDENSDDGTEVEEGRLYHAGEAIYLEIKQPITFSSLFTGSY